MALRHTDFDTFSFKAVMAALSAIAIVLLIAPSLIVVIVSFTSA